MKVHFKTAVTVILTAWIALTARFSVADTTHTLWSGTIPAVMDTGPDSPVELGVKFRADAAGLITAIRFYKAPGNTGVHVANLWSSNGVRLATATFSNETAAGWQQASFATPVAINANTVYVASYHTNSGHYSDDVDFFLGKSIDNPPLHAPADGQWGPNGVYAYGSTSSFPTSGWNSSNYWVDVVFSPSTPDSVAPVLTSFTLPATSASLTVRITDVSATDNVGIGGYFVSQSSTAPSPNAAGWSATAPVSYTFSSAGDKTLYCWAKDLSGNLSASRRAQVTISLPSDRPILLVTSSANPFTSYYAEILRAEGLNAFTAREISSISSSVLAGYPLVLLGEMPLTSSQVALFTTYVTNGGHLIAMRPDKKLAPLLGLTYEGDTLSNGYLRVDTSVPPGKGIVGSTIQFHGSADLYSPSGASVLATIYATSSTPTPSPAVSVISVGANGGQAAAFSYDLARSVVYTRQGNPQWAGTERDGASPIRSNDLFFGPAAYDPERDWVDSSRISIPQADEQQRLLANLMIQMNLDTLPLPRFWYLPRNLLAAVVMTGDDHGTGGTAGRFDSYLAVSPPNCSVPDWECIRSTSYIYTPTPLTPFRAVSYSDAGFEVALHIDTGCTDFTPSSLESDYSLQLSDWKNKYLSLPSPVTNRTHCVVWSDYATQPVVEERHGIRLDTTYYFWPPNWVSDRPGLFTGSAMPMRFADGQGNVIDVYQAPTQMTDESGQSYPFTIDTLLDNATGPKGFYGFFVANAHTDSAYSAVSEAIVNSAISHEVPVISARQMLIWLDGRNESTISGLSRSAGNFSFTIGVAEGANGLVVMVPSPDRETIAEITLNGVSIPFNLVRIKGIQYAAVAAESGIFSVSYATSNTSPTVTETAPEGGATGVAVTTVISAAFNAAMDPSTITSETFSIRDTSNTVLPATVSYDTASDTATLATMHPLRTSTSYTVTARGGSSGIKTVEGTPLADDYVWSFSTTSLGAGQSTIWTETTLPSQPDGGQDSPVEIGIRFRSDASGYITGIRFYKHASNTGTHVAHLWTSSGTLLATGTFSSETSSGWQQLNFTTPIPVTANTVYVASYHTDVGHYADDQFYFQNRGVDSPPLHAPPDGSGGFNGVYAYGPSGTFPNQGWNSSNYWVDVVFTTSFAGSGFAPSDSVLLAFLCQKPLCR